MRQDTEHRTNVRIYTAGYGSQKSIPKFAEFMERTGSLLVDVRFRPASRNPNWSRSWLQKRFGSEYLWLKALGNVNYKNGGPIELLDPEAALVILAPIIATRPLLLLCACKDHRECH